MSAQSGPPLYLTGERTLPGIESETYWFCRHVAGYRWARDAVAAASGQAGPRRILDSGCGEGYGTAMLAVSGPQTAATGIDVFPDAVRHAALTYPGSAFACGNAEALPFPDASFDAVVSLQVIEHLTDPVAYVAECARVLTPGGVFCVGTPNRLTFTPPGRPKNPFHVVEFTAEELVALVGAYFSEVNAAGLHDSHPGLADALIEAAFAAADPPAWATATVPTVGVEDFDVSTELETCLDLLVQCR